MELTSEDSLRNDMQYKPPLHAALGVMGQARPLRHCPLFDGPTQRSSSRRTASPWPLAEGAIRSPTSIVARGAFSATSSVRSMNHGRHQIDPPRHACAVLARLGHPTAWRQLPTGTRRSACQRWASRLGAQLLGGLGRRGMAGKRRAARPSPTTQISLARRSLPTPAAATAASHRCGSPTGPSPRSTSPPAARRSASPRRLVPRTGATGSALR